MATGISIFRKAGSVRPLGALAAGLTRIQNALYQQPDTTIPNMQTTDWPSPLQPVRPFGGPDAAPLGMNILMGQNLIYTPRPDSRYTAPDLQALARYPLARICITNVIDTISSLKWKIQLKAQPGEDRKTRESKQLKDDTILKLTDFVAQPDADHDFAEWIRPLLNDMLTIDGGCVYMRRTKDNTVFEWRVMQGAYITRLIDKNGFIPEAPAPAYQQLWDGIPRVNLTADQLIYKPRNIVYEVDNVASSLYGMSPTEQLAPEIEVGIQRLRYVNNFYKDGTIPNVLWVVPADINPDTVASAMKVLNQDMAGNLSARRQFRMAQGFRNSDSQKEEFIKQLEEPKLSDEYDDLHTRRICFGYGTSPQRLLRMQNRATAQTNQEAAEEEGIAPFRKWAEDLINQMLQRKMGFDKYEFLFDVSMDPDPAKQAEIDKAELDNSKVTINEVRVRSGLDPRPEPEADQLGKWLPTGWMGISEDPPQPTAAKPDPKPASDAGTGADDGPEPEPKPDPKKKDKAASIKSDTAAVLNPDHDSIRQRTARTAMQSHIWHFFHSITSTMVIVNARSKKMRKAEDDEKRIDQIVEAIMAGIKWKELPEKIEPQIEEVALDGAQNGLEQMERAFQAGPMVVNLSPTPVRVISSSVISEVNQVARDYAKDRSAELVGMKWVDGELVTNPNAEMAISDSTRNMLREIITEAFAHEAPMSELVGRIKNDGVFSEERAKLIAHTEVKFAQAGGNLAAWKKAGIVKTIRSYTSALHQGPDECDDNEEAGPIELGKKFPSGHETSPFHQNCNCTVAIAELNDPKDKAP